MQSDKCLRNGNITWVYPLSDMRAFIANLKNAFSHFDPPEIKLICGLLFSSFCRDIHFQDFENMSSFRYKIKFAKYHFGSETTYIAYTFNVFFVLFFLLFFVQYIFVTSHESHLGIKQSFPRFSR